MIPVISPNYFMQKASYMQAKLIADTIQKILEKILTKLEFEFQNSVSQTFRMVFAAGRLTMNSAKPLLLSIFSRRMCSSECSVNKNCFFKEIEFCQVWVKYVRFPRGLIAKKDEEGILTPVV